MNKGNRNYQKIHDACVVRTYGNIFYFNSLCNL